MSKPIVIVLACNHCGETVIDDPQLAEMQRHTEIGSPGCGGTFVYMSADESKRLSDACKTDSQLGITRR